MTVVPTAEPFVPGSADLDALRVAAQACRCCELYRGATAAEALFGASFRVTRQRAELLPWPDSAQQPADFPPGRHALATIHPSAVLRVDDRDAAFDGLVADLRVLAVALG